jgi:hypothetical protein
MNTPKMIPTVRVVNLRDTADDYPGQLQTPLQNLATLEQIRREYHQWKYNAEPRLQKVYSIY